MSTDSQRSDTPPQCPVCHQRDAVVPIHYGLINPDGEYKAALERGEFVLGGCCVQDENRYCKRCGHSFVVPVEPPSMEEFSVLVNKLILLRRS
jgi:hypothetical protein